VRHRGVGVDDRIGIVGVAVGREQTTRFTGAIGELVIEILASGIAVELDCAAARRRFLKHALSVG